MPANPGPDSRICPLCHRDTFEGNTGSIRRCGHCSATGWIGDEGVPIQSGAQPPLTCAVCMTRTLHRIPSSQAYFCSSCHSVVVDTRKPVQVGPARQP